MKESKKIKVEVEKVAFILCRLHNLLHGINQQGLMDRLAGRTPVGVLDARLEMIKKDVISLLAENSENGHKIESAPSPYYWEPQDILKQLGGLK